MNELTELIEENLREYLYCASSTLNQLSSGTIFSSGDLTTSSQINDVLDDLESDRDRLALGSLLREGGLFIEHSHLDNIVGVVVEFGVELGVDAFAAYSDGTAAWYDCAGPKMVEVELKGKSKVNLDHILLAAKKISDVTKPSDSLPLQPSAGFALISLINDKGISFGLGKSRDMAMDSICGPIIKGALTIRTEII